MKTIKQIADEIGVSKTAVRNKIKNQFPEVIEKFSETRSRTLYINTKGEKLIKSAFNKNESQTNQKQFSETSRKPNENQFADKFALEALVKQLEEKDKQLAEKDKQLADLTATIKAQAQAINALNQTGLTDKLIEGKQIFEGDSHDKPEKKSFMSRWFGK